jgi:hypothetical protein
MRWYNEEQRVDKLSVDKLSVDKLTVDQLTVCMYLDQLTVAFCVSGHFMSVGI